MPERAIKTPGASRKDPGVLALHGYLVSWSAHLRPRPDLTVGGQVNGTLQLAKYEQHRRESMRERAGLGALATKRFPVPPARHSEPPGWWPDELPKLRVKEWNHILYGDRSRDGSSAGGHAYGFGWRNDRSEFPSDWDENRIAKAIEQVLRSNQTGRYRIGNVNGVDVAVVVSPRGQAVSAFPIERG